MKLAICIATRGLVHSRTIESVYKNIEPNLTPTDEYKFFFTHDMVIPDAQNKLVVDAMVWGADYLWFVEEDMLIPDGVLQGMLAENKPVMAVDYPVGEKRYSTLAIKGGEILWCGLGCTLFARDVFEKTKGKEYGKWFETDKTVRITDKDKMEYVIDENVPYKYGGHDILFGIKLRENGIPIVRLPGVIAGHMRVEDYGKRETNSGVHTIKTMDRIENYQLYD